MLPLHLLPRPLASAGVAKGLQSVAGAQRRKGFVRLARRGAQKKPVRVIFQGSVKYEVLFMLTVMWRRGMWNTVLSLIPLSPQRSCSAAAAPTSATDSTAVGDIDDRTAKVVQSARGFEVASVATR